MAVPTAYAGQLFGDPKLPQMLYLRGLGKINPGDPDITSYVWTMTALPPASVVNQGKYGDFNNGQAVITGPPFSANPGDVLLPLDVHGTYSFSFAAFNSDGSSALATISVTV